MSPVPWKQTVRDTARGFNQRGIDVEHQLVGAISVASATADLEQACPQRQPVFVFKIADFVFQLDAAALHLQTGGADLM